MRCALATLVLIASTAGATAGDCRDAVVTASTRYVQSTMKAVAACAGRHVPDCHADPRTGARVARAAVRLAAAAVVHCCGADRQCGTGDDESLGAIGWGAGYCPNLDRGDCNGLVVHPGDVAACLACIGRAAVDDVLAFTQVPPAADPTAARCETAARKESARLVVATSKALGRCWAARGAGTHANACPTPGDGIAGPALVAATTRATTAMCRACGGADQACGGSDDVALVGMGFPASCPAVAVPGGPACGGPVATVAELVRCVICLAGHDAACGDHAAVPAFVSYPAECADPPGTCGAGVECTTAADCPAGYACLDNGSGTTRYCVGSSCASDGECGGGAVCRQYCTFSGCTLRRCMCPGFACGASEVCIDDGGLSCRQICTQDSDCPPPLGVCVNSTFEAGLCINSTPCQ